MPNDPTPDFGWVRTIGSELASIREAPIVVGHSLGASMSLKYLSEHEAPVHIRGVFLIATPFWTADEDWKLGLTLRTDFPRHLHEHLPIFLYHAEDDEEVQISDLAIYEEQLPQATIRRISTGGHQLGEGISLVATDIKRLN